VKIVSKKRHNPDLNRNTLSGQAFQACAIPGYAIVADYYEKTTGLL
jgi:hypothetical protein